MRRFIFPFIALLGLVSAAAGLWSGGLRREIAIATVLRQFPRPDDTPFFRSPDSFYWTSYAREMLETGEARVRFTQLDNAPYGRANLGWASLNAWYLVALDKCWSFATGLPETGTLPSISCWASPILYFFSLAAILLIGWRIRNFPAAAAAVLMLGTSPRIYDDFAYAVPGHHGWHDLACFGTLVALAAAIRNSSSRRWFATAGLFGAVAMWIGITQQAFGLAAAGIAANVGMLLCRFMATTRPTPLFAVSSLDLPPAEGWRVFGLTGASAALFFYFIEYMPDSVAMRLEVNHPVYALGFFLGGEFLCRAQRLIFSAPPRRGRDLGIAVAIACLLAAIVALIFFGPADWHTMRQPFIQRLHEEIAEFQSIVRSNGRESIVILGAPIFLVISAIARALRRNLPARERVSLLVCAFPCAVAIALSFLQLRWAGIAGASAAAIAAVLFTGVKIPKGVLVSRQIGGDHRTAFGIPILPAAFLVLAMTLVVFWHLRRDLDDTAEVRRESIERMATWEVASVLKADAKTNHPIAVFSDQKIRQAWIGYVAGISGVGALYWDNPVGIRDEAELLATYDDETAHRIARTRGINYIVTTPNGGSVIAYHYMWQGNKTAPLVRQTLAYRLAAPTPNPPPWLQLIPTETQAMIDEGVRIYRVL